MEERWMVVDTKNGLQVGRPCKSRRAAQRRADRLDAEYGAVRYVVRALTIGVWK